MRMKPLGDTALIVEVGEGIDEPTHARVQQTLAVLEARPVPGVTELVPAYTTVTLFYDPIQVCAAGAPPEDIAGWLALKVRQTLEQSGETIAAPRGRTIEIPVCYDAEFALDLPEIAQKSGLGEAEVVRRHAAAEYLVYMIGFAPGFPYLGGLPAELALPRRATPRTRVAAGSVGVIGAQCCIYPIETPGGWNLIGRTPARLFRPEENPPVLLRAGDRVTFRPITRAEFDAALKP